LHIKHDLSIAHIFCSVLQLSKQQKPQNSEAVTYIIAKASRPIRKHPIVETTKPPTYLFSFYQCQRAPKAKNPAPRHFLGAPPNLVSVPHDAAVVRWSGI
jgi:hypothetical protein